MRGEECRLAERTDSQTENSTQTTDRHLEMQTDRKGPERKARD